MMRVRTFNPLVVGSIPTRPTHIHRFERRSSSDSRAATASFCKHFANQQFETARRCGVPNRNSRHAALGYFESGRVRKE